MGLLRNKDISECSEDVQWLVGQEGCGECSVLTTGVCICGVEDPGFVCLYVVCVGTVEDKGGADPYTRSQWWEVGGVGWLIIP